MLYSCIGIRQKYFQTNTTKNCNTHSILVKEIFRLVLEYNWIHNNCWGSKANDRQEIESKLCSWSQCASDFQMYKCVMFKVSVCACVCYLFFIHLFPFLKCFFLSLFVQIKLTTLLHSVSFLVLFCHVFSLFSFQTFSQFVWTVWKTFFLMKKISIPNMNIFVYVDFTSFALFMNGFPV